MIDDKDWAHVQRAADHAARLVARGDVADVELTPNDGTKYRVVLVPPRPKLCAGCSPPHWEALNNHTHETGQWLVLAGTDSNMAVVEASSLLVPRWKFEHVIENRHTVEVVSRFVVMVAAACETAAVIGRDTR